MDISILMDRSRRQTRDRTSTPCTSTSWDGSVQVGDMGCEGCDIVDAVGADVEGLAVGDMVAWHGSGVSFRENVILPAVSTHRFKRTGGSRGPLLRFPVDQGPNRRDPIMIRVAHDGEE